MLLRLIGKNRDVQSSQLRALCHLLPPLSDYSVAADNQSRSYSCGSTTAPPLRNTEQCGLPGLADGTLNSAARRIQPHSAASQAGVLGTRHSYMSNAALEAHARDLKCNGCIAESSHGCVHDLQLAIM